VNQNAVLYRPSPRVRWGRAMAKMVRFPRLFLSGGRRHDAYANLSGTLRQVRAAVGSPWVRATSPLLLESPSADSVISFRFNNAGARTFARYTAENAGRPFAIVLDDVVLSSPVIREPILGGSGQVSGNFTVEAAKQLAVQLHAGALPAKLAVVEERVVPIGR